MKRLVNTVIFRMVITLLFCVVLTWSILLGNFTIAIPAGILFIVSCRGVYLQYIMHARKVTFMLNAIENDDFSFKFSSDSPLRSDIQVSQTLNRITAIIQKATYSFVLAMASFTVSPLRNSEFIMTPSFASKLSSLTSQPSISGMMGKLKCLANA